MLKFQHFQYTFDNIYSFGSKMSNEQNTDNNESHREQEKVIQNSSHEVHLIKSQFELDEENDEKQKKQEISLQIRHSSSHEADQDDIDFQSDIYKELNSGVYQIEMQERDDQNQNQIDQAIEESQKLQLNQQKSEKIKHFQSTNLTSNCNTVQKQQNCQKSQSKQYIFSQQQNYNVILERSHVQQKPIQKLIPSQQKQNQIRHHLQLQNSEIVFQEIESQEQDYRISQQIHQKVQEEGKVQKSAELNAFQFNFQQKQTKSNKLEESIQLNTLGVDENYEKQLLKSEYISKIKQKLQYPHLQQISPKSLKTKQKLIALSNQQKKQKEQDLSNLDTFQQIDQGIAETKKNLSIKLTGYYSKYFLKIETQIYQIQIKKENNIIKIERQYSEFLFLYKIVSMNYLGKILYPFPQKNFQLFLKLKLSFGQKQQKVETIQKRLMELEHFLNFLLGDETLCKCQEVGWFLDSDRSSFDEKMSYYEELMRIHEEQLYSSSNLRGVISSGFSYLKSFISKTMPEKDENKDMLIETQRSKLKEVSLQFDSYLSTCKETQEKIKTLIEKIEEMFVLQKTLSTFQDIRTDSDAVLKINAKISSCKQFNHTLSSWLENQFLEALTYVWRHIAQIIQQLAYRQTTTLAIHSYRSDQQKFQRFTTLLKRVRKFDQNFKNDWSYVSQKWNSIIELQSKKFYQKWLDYCRMSAKVWK